MEIILIVVAYLLGSIPTSVWVGKTFYNTDVRNEGSGNAGATNTIRVLGWKIGLFVLIMDVFKGWLAVFLSTLIVFDPPIAISLPLYQIILAALAVVGHIFPVYVNFKGGKGVATLLGVAIALFPWEVVVIELIVFAIIFSTSRIVSISSIVVGVSLPFFMIFLFPVELPILILAIVIAVFIPITHHKNITRLFKGEEKKLKFRKS